MGGCSSGRGDLFLLNSSFSASRISLLTGKGRKDICTEKSAITEVFHCFYFSFLLPCNVSAVKPLMKYHSYEKPCKH